MRVGRRCGAQGQPQLHLVSSAEGGGQLGEVLGWEVSRLDLSFSETEQM